jgi:hypothetical protein
LYYTGRFAYPHQSAASDGRYIHHHIHNRTVLLLDHIENLQMESLAKKNEGEVA